VPYLQRRNFVFVSPFFFLITEGSAGKTMWFLSIEYSSSTMVKMV